MGNLDRLLKNDTQTIFSPSNDKCQYTRTNIRGICNSLSVATGSYNPEKTANSIKNFLESKNKLDRILYSEISSYIYSLKLTERGIFLTNIDNLLQYATTEDNYVDIDCIKIIIKIYDHAQLVSYQIENINNIFAKSIEDTKDNLNKEIKGIQKEYISILGIFAAIMLAFVGSMTFSSSILQNMHQVSMYRLILTIDMISFCFYNLIHLLLKFICHINDKKELDLKIGWFNGLCICIAFITVLTKFNC